MTNYVVGFLFSPDRKQVSLITKAKPAWQAGKLNGIGGKIEADESPIEAIHREFNEEAGVEELDWKYRLILQSEHFVLHVFSAYDEKINQVKTMEKEHVDVYQTSELYYLPLIDNLRWMIPLLLDRDGGDRFLGSLDY